MDSDDIPFNKQLRKATSDIHSVSDALVNAKLAFTLSSDDVWAEGLLIFYEVFRYLEAAMDRHPDHPLGKMKIQDICRTEAFEKDLAYYLGPDWKKTYEIRPAVAKYLAHLEKLEKENPLYLVVYVYHLYMGLLSGGHILKKKRNFSNKLLFSSKNIPDGNNLTDFGSCNIYNLKTRIVKTINSIAENLDKDTKEKLLEESKKVFVLNNEIIGTIKGAKEVLIKKLSVLALVSVSAVLVYSFVS